MTGFIIRSCSSEPSTEKHPLFRAIQGFKSGPPDYDGDIEGETFAMTSRLNHTAIQLAAAGAIALLSATPSSAQTQPAQAQPRQAAYHDRAALKRTVEEFLQVQTGGLPGQVTVAVGAIDPRMSLAPCPDPQAFFMPGARLGQDHRRRALCDTVGLDGIYSGQRDGDRRVRRQRRAAGPGPGHRGGPVGDAQGRFDNVAGGDSHRHQPGGRPQQQ